MVIIYFLMGYAKCKDMKMVKWALITICIFHHQKMFHHHDILVLADK